MLQQQLADLWQPERMVSMANPATGTLLHMRGDWDPPAGIIPRRELIPMAIGVPDSDTIPRSAILEAARGVIEAPGDAAFVYGFGMGHAGLRDSIAARYRQHRGLDVDQDWFVLTNGSSGAIDLVCRTLIEPGDVIIAEAPTFMGTLRNFRGLQADVRPVSMDKDGMNIDALEDLIDALHREGRPIKLIYTISTFHNPTGATMSLPRRLALLRLAARHGILILDDDAYGELHFVSDPPPTLAALSNGHGVITVGTFSKILATGLRIGWILGRPEALPLFNNMRFAMGLNQLVVRVVERYMANGVLDQHVRSVRGLYQRKMSTFADALDHYAGDVVSFERPAGGFYLWVNTGELKAEDVWRTAMEEGVTCTPGTNFFPGRADPTGNHIRIAFPWTPSAQLDEGARRFATACRRVRDGDAAAPG